MTLQVNNLSCRRGGRLVLNGISFDVESGRALLVTGPNGAGKSSMLRVLAGLTKPERGEVTLGTTSLAGSPDDWTAQIGFAGHQDAIKPQLTLQQNLRFWAQINGGGDVAQALACFNLSRLADRPAQTCSAGQRKRLSLARLLLAKRKLWLLDEPATSLDSDSQFSLEQILKTHCANGGIAVIATHQPLNLANSTTLRLTPIAQSGDPFQVTGP